MDNLKRPAYPQPLTIGSDGSILTPWQHDEDFAGFTKLEKAALIIAQGIYASYKDPGDDFVVTKSVNMAARIIEACNK